MKKVWIFPVLYLVLMSSAAAQSIYVRDAWWSGSGTDPDCDGYLLDRSLYVDVDTNAPATQNVTITVTYYNRAGMLSSSRSKSASITGANSADLVLFSSFDAPEVATDVYQITITVVKDGATVATYGRNQDPDLANQKIESWSGESRPRLGLSEFGWSDESDPDEDGYLLLKTLNLKATATGPMPCGSYFCTILLRQPAFPPALQTCASGTFMLDDASRVNDWSHIVGPRPPAYTAQDLFEFGQYDFGLEWHIGDPGGHWYSIEWVDSLGILKGNKFETEAQNQAPIGCDKMVWSSAHGRVDQDGDGFRSLDTLRLTTGSWSECYYKLFFRPAGQTGYTFYANTRSHILDPSATISQIIGTPGIELPHGFYDLKLELYNTNTGHLVATYDEKSHPALNDQKFEMKAEDNPAVSSCTLHVTQSGFGTGRIRIHDQMQRLPFSVTVAPGSSVTLQAVPLSFSVFSGWTGASSSTAPELSLKMDTDQELNALFDLAPGYPNMVRNPDFSAASDWFFWVLTPNSAAGTFEDGEFVVRYMDPGTERWHVQLIQGLLPMEKGKTYDVLFDAWAAAPKIINAWAGKDGDPWTYYSSANLDTLTTARTRYNYRFTMNHPGDAAARIVFDVGLTSPELHLDRIALVKEGETGIEEPAGPGLPRDFSLSSYPNPFNDQTIVRYELPVAGLVHLAVYDLMGREVAVLAAATQPAGEHQAGFHAGTLSSGIYFCRLAALGADGRPYRMSRKLMLMR